MKIVLTLGAAVVVLIGLIKLRSQQGKSDVWHDATTG